MKPKATELENRPKTNKELVKEAKAVKAKLNIKERYLYHCYMPNRTEPAYTVMGHSFDRLSKNRTARMKANPDYRYSEIKPL